MIAGRSVSRGREAPGKPVVVYALISGRSPKMFTTSRGERLRVVRLPAGALAKAGSGMLAAVVSDRSRMSSSPANLRRYDHVMRELAARFPAMLPARFGTSVEEDELMFILSSRRASLARALTTVRGRVQMTIRVLARGVAEDRAIAQAGEERAGVVTGRDYLAGKARTARAVAGFEPVRAAVAKWVRDERVDRRAGVSSIYHLIPRSSAGAYRRAVHASAASAGLQLTVSGPWPPYAFAAD
jgi:gas vesicle protein GvpL/GvpF